MNYDGPYSGVLVWQSLLTVFFGGTFFLSRICHCLIAAFLPQRNNFQGNNSGDATAIRSMSDIN